jgi:hypothetical protein
MARLHVRSAATPVRGSKRGTHAHRRSQRDAVATCDARALNVYPGNARRTL